VPWGGCEESGLPTSQIGVPVSSIQNEVCAAHPNVAAPRNGLRYDEKRRLEFDA
jgi:hypothetical protein